MNYCNKTDLQNVYSNIEDFHRLEQLEDFTASGDNYLKRDTGKIVLVLEDDTELTEATDNNLDTGEWYYDGTNDILYVRCSDDGDPEHTRFNLTQQHGTT